MQKTSDRGDAGSTDLTGILLKANQGGQIPTKESEDSF